MNDDVKSSLAEDAEDLAAFKERAHEPNLAFEDVLIESATKKDRLRILKRIQDLSSDPRPRGRERLSGHDDKYRVRQGTHRIVYTISMVHHLVIERTWEGGGSLPPIP